MGSALTERQVTVEIQNESEYTLTDYSVYLHRGHAHINLPATILPRASGSGLYVHTYLTARGSAAVFTYTLRNAASGQEHRKVAVLFDAPFDYLWYINSFALGVFEVDRTCNSHLYEYMHDYAGPEFRKCPAKEPSGISVTRDGVTVTGTMTDTFQPVLSVTISSSSTEY